MTRSIAFLVASSLFQFLGHDGSNLVDAYTTSVRNTCRLDGLSLVRPRQSIKHRIPNPTFLPNLSRRAVCLHESTDDFVEAEDLPAIQALFNKYCDSDGLMSKEALETVPVLAGMLSDGDLLPEELTDIWDVAPKFPGVDTADVRIDVDSFVQIYRDVDDLFEDEEDDAQDGKEEKGADSTVKDETKDDVDDDDDVDEEEEAELEAVFASICDKDNLISKESLRAWDEVAKLISEGLLGETEFDEIWSQTQKPPGSSSQLDVDGFLSFNVALDGLFEFEDDDEDEDEDESGDDTKTVSPEQSESEPQQRQVVEGDDLPPGVLFAAIANEDYLVGMEEMKSWGSLQEMLSGGDLLPLELQNIFEGIEKAPGTDDKLTEDGFMKLYEEIDDLFEEEDEEGEDAPQQEAQPEVPTGNQVKEDLLSFLDEIAEYSEGLPCGLDSTESEQREVLSIVDVLEKQPTNMISIKNGNIEMTDLAGTWDLLYSSSSAMKFNQGLSGLGGSFPNGKFGGLKQKLVASKYLTDVEYVEHIEVNPETASFDVTVTGSWDLRTSVSLFTGAPSIVLNIEPGMVTYGPTSTRGDHWKSLGPMNMLDLSYLDEDFRVMRGCTSSDTLFIFKRST